MFVREMTMNGKLANSSQRFFYSPPSPIAQNRLNLRLRRHKNRSARRWRTESQGTIRRRARLRSSSRRVLRKEWPALSMEWIAYRRLCWRLHFDNYSHYMHSPAKYLMWFFVLMSIYNLINTKLRNQMNNLLEFYCRHMNCVGFYRPTAMYRVCRMWDLCLACMSSRRTSRSFWHSRNSHVVCLVRGRWLLENKTKNINRLVSKYLKIGFGVVVRPSNVF